MNLFFILIICFLQLIICFYLRIQVNIWTWLEWNHLLELLEWNCTQTLPFGGMRAIPQHCWYQSHISLSPLEMLPPADCLCRYFPTSRNHLKPVLISDHWYCSLCNCYFILNGALFNFAESKIGEVTEGPEIGNNNLKTMIFRFNFGMLYLWSDTP